MSEMHVTVQVNDARPGIPAAALEEAIARDAHVRALSDVGALSSSCRVRTFSAEGKAGRIEFAACLVDLGVSGFAVQVHLSDWDRYGRPFAAVHWDGVDL